MEKILLQTAKIVGTVSPQAWSQVHAFSPIEEEKLARRGQLLAVISLSELTQEVEVVAAGREIISRLHEGYYGQIEEKAIIQLKKAIEQVISESAKEAKLEIEAAVLLEETIYFAIAGEGKVLIQREGKMATVLKGEEGKVEVASGGIEDNDMFLLGSQKFFSLLADGSIKAALLSNSASEAAETLTPMIHGREEDGTAAAAVLRIKKVIREGETAELEKPGPIEKKETKPTRVLKYLSQLLEQIAIAFQLLLFKLEKKIKHRAIYLSEEEKEKRKPQKTLMTIAVILLFLLLVSVIFGARERSRTRQAGGTAILAEAKVKKQEGEALIDLNPIRARQLLLESKSLIEKIKPEERNQAVIDFQSGLEKSLSLVLKEHEVEPTVIFDLDLIKDGAKGDDLDVSGKELIVFDKEKKTIYSLEIGGKKSAILVGGEELTDGKQVAAFLPKIFLLTKKGIFQFDKETKRLGLVIEADENWGEIIDLRAFGGNLYLLDKKGEIWKYPSIEIGFGASRLWLKGEKPDFSDALEMAIDGSVWVLKADGTILKYTQGAKDHFVISGLDKPLNNPTSIFTDDDQEKIYILDKGNSRVLVVDKSGEYNSQYIWSGIGEVNGLITSEEDKIILLLSGSKIYKIDI